MPNKVVAAACPDCSSKCHINVPEGKAIQKILQTSRVSWTDACDASASCPNGHKFYIYYK